jgi:hypothetical protein
MQVNLFHQRIQTLAASFVDSALEVASRLVHGENSVELELRLWNAISERFRGTIRRQRLESAGVRPSEAAIRRSVREAIMIVAGSSVGVERATQEMPVTAEQRATWRSLIPDYQRSGEWRMEVQPA